MSKCLADSALPGSECLSLADFSAYLSGNIPETLQPRIIDAGEKAEETHPNLEELPLTAHESNLSPSLAGSSIQNAHKSNKEERWSEEEKLY
jgi:hypothetical protein